MIVKANAAGVLGTGHYVPDRVVTNKELEKYVDTSDEWIQSVPASKRVTLPKTE